MPYQRRRENLYLFLCQNQNIFKQYINENDAVMDQTDNLLPLIIEPEDLAKHINDTNLLIVDLCKVENYLRGHVPGAVYLPFQLLITGTPPAPGKLPAIEVLEKIFSSLGLTPETHVVAYDDEGGGWAGRLIWTLDMIGHTRYSYLNGGILAWEAANQTMDTQPNTPSATSEVKVSLNQQFAVEKNYILDRIGAEDLAIWDARSPEEYNGEKKLADKAGHIPGSVNYEWTDGMDTDRQLRIRDLETIRSELANIGITDAKEIITHCQTHHRSGFTYLLGKALGFSNIKAYPGSWSEWGNDASTPVE